ncbi:hypothetical protein HDU85_006113 [Gaertneriomyces sp. JEL0708]|nr:hypothetical protein HDU85_006113 [Gaertneriomyces sp. JEL0708]
MSHVKAETHWPTPLVSRQELREKLYDSLLRNLTPKLKAQVRSHIYHHLAQDSLLPGQQNAGSPTAGISNQTGNERPLLYLLIDSLLYEYLRSRELEFTISVFLAESGLTGRVLSRRDVEQGVGLESEVPGVRSLKAHFATVTSTNATTKSLLTTLISALISLSATSQLHIGTQTDSPSTSSKWFPTISQTPLRDPLRDNAAMEEKLSRYQQEIESRCRREMTELEIEREREKEEWQKEKRRHDIEKEVWQREKQERERERRIFEEGRDEWMRKTVEWEKKEQDLRAENVKLNQTITTLKQAQPHPSRKVTLESQLSTLSHRQKEIETYKESLSHEYSTLIKNLEFERMRLDDRELQLVDERENMSREREFWRGKEEEYMKRIEDLTRALEDTREQYFQKHSNIDKTVNMKPSKELEFEISSLKKQLLLNEQKVASYAKSLPTDLVLKLQKCEKRCEKWKNECQDLVSRLDAEIERSETLLRQLDDKEIYIRELKRTVAGLKVSIYESRVGEYGDRGYEYGVLPDPKSYIYDAAESDRRFNDLFIEQMSKGVTLPFPESKNEYGPVDYRHVENAADLHLRDGHDTHFPSMNIKEKRIGLERDVSDIDSLAHRLIMGDLGLVNEREANLERPAMETARAGNDFNYESMNTGGKVRDDVYRSEEVSKSGAITGKPRGTRVTVLGDQDLPSGNEVEKAIPTNAQKSEDGVVGVAERMRREIEEREQQWQKERQEDREREREIESKRIREREQEEQERQKERERAIEMKWERERELEREKTRQFHQERELREEQRRQEERERERARELEIKRSNEIEHEGQELERKSNEELERAGPTINTGKVESSSTDTEPSAPTRREQEEVIPESSAPQPQQLDKKESTNAPLNLDTFSIDPTLQKYLDIVKQKRQQEQAQNVPIINPLPIHRNEVTPKTGDTDDHDEQDEDESLSISGAIGDTRTDLSESESEGSSESESPETGSSSVDS